MGSVGHIIFLAPRLYFFFSLDGKRRVVFVCKNGREVYLFFYLLEDRNIVVVGVEYIQAYLLVELLECPDKKAELFIRIVLVEGRVDLFAVEYEDWDYFV